MENKKVNRYAFWNNKGGTGKTSLLFQSSCLYAEKHLSERILVLDLCPQANLSELFLGGLMGNGATGLSNLQAETPRRTVGGYFESRLPAPYTTPSIKYDDFISIPSNHNREIPKNIHLLAGDPLLELQSNAIATLANAQIPGQKPWLAVVNWISDFIECIKNQYDTVFIDTNPSFSMYTQIALSASTKLVIPIMADDSSRRAIQNAFTLIHGLTLKKSIYSDYSFSSKLIEANHTLPIVHLIPKNRLTQYMGAASGYASVLDKIESFVAEIITVNPEIFSFSTTREGFVEIRDFGTTGVVAFAKGTPFSRLQTGKHNIAGREIQINKDYLENCISAVREISDRL